MACPLVITGVAINECDDGGTQPSQDQIIPLAPCVEIDVTLNAFPVDEVELYYVSIFGQGRRVAVSYDSQLPRAIFTWFVPDNADGWLIITARIGDCATVFTPLRVQAEGAAVASPVTGTIGLQVK